MKKIKVNGLITEELQKYLIERFNNASAGIGQCAYIVYNASKFTDEGEIVDNLRVLDQIRRASLKEIMGAFTPNEWMFFADILNGTMITAEFRCLQSGLIAEMEDSIHFDNAAAKWKIDADKLYEKVERLTGAQIDALYYRVEQFWKDENRDLEKWSKW